MRVKVDPHGAAGSEERRKQRSSDAHTALSLQLARVRDEASLEAVILATAEGLLIAHAGDSELCSELAALAPVICSEGAVPANSNLGTGLMHVQTVAWEGAPLYLAGSQGAEELGWDLGEPAWVERARRGVTRILAA